MKNTVVVAGVAAAFLVLAPTAALAAAPTATPSAPATSASPSPSAQPTEPEYPDGPMTRVKKQLSLSPGKGLPGARVNFDFGCSAWPGEKVGIRSAAVVADNPGLGTGTVANVKPGRYAVTLHCGIEASTAYFQVLPAKGPAPKQVAKVPAGAPQTGGTDGPADGSGAPLAAAAAMGVLAVGGSGLVVARRARRR
ncbi:hypothetical protein OG439_43435 [Amycolatopsis sp. NBC_01307]|uniref:hypothetical protein n=1 Tax=Amycolatopsis sp. NBC_01307 TaxID=2903561 RepID=UPI002E14AC93|nr:hypothetical protein OG439_43435 [Amycolatopsis sp. NBC_01307]